MSWEYSDQALATFPRYLVWEAIRDEVERIEPQTFSNLNALRDGLVAAGWRAQTMMTLNPALVSVEATMAEERKQFEDLVRSLPESHLDAVEPLPLRRVLGKEELQQLWETVNARWEVNPGHYWWPLREGPQPLDVIAFHTDWFDGEKVAILRAELISHGVDRIRELREFGEWGCEQGIGRFEPTYNGEEGYWTSAELDWLVYASHESSITLAGEWLVRTFRQRFPECDRFAYAGPMSTPDRRGTW